MPSKKPRIALTVPDDIMAVLKECADLQGKPVSALIVDTLREMLPTFIGLVNVTKAVKEGNDEAVKLAVRNMFSDSLATVILQDRKP